MLGGFVNQTWVFLLALFFASPAMAGYKGSISFSNSEKNYHVENVSTLTWYAAQCLYDIREEHVNFYRNNCQESGKCLSKFYGDRRYSKMRGAVRPDGQPLEYLWDTLEAEGFSTDHFDDMQNMSCVGMTLDCLEYGFSMTGEDAQWERIKEFTLLNDVDGTALQHALQALGWTIYYWNPSPEETIIQDMRAWDEEEANWQSKGYHEYRYNNVMNNGTYWNNRVDNSWDMVGFGEGQPWMLSSVNFWVGTAHTGYHVFPGAYGDVVEAHSTRHITDQDNIELSKFSPFAKGGGPIWTPTEKYRSGLIALPPSLW